MTLKSKNLPLTKAKAEIVKHKKVEANKIQKVKDELNPIDCTTTGVAGLWSVVFPKAHIFYTKPEDLPDSLELNEEQYEALKQLKEALSKYIGFLRRELSPVILQSKSIQNEMKLKYACLRENTTYYGQKTESKLEQSYSVTAKYLDEYSLYAMQKAVDDYVAPKLKGAWNQNTQQYEAPEYPFPPLGELRSKLNQYHRLGVAFLHNCEFILSIDIA